LFAAIIAIGGVLALDKVILCGIPIGDRGGMYPFAEGFGSGGPEIVHQNWSFCASETVSSTTLS